jgi:hypothetical protein
MLGASGFGHASALYTLLMLVTAITLSFQIVTSKFVARNSETISPGANLRQHAAPGLAGRLGDCRTARCRQRLPQVVFQPASAA